jgi:hypothetical protein
MNQDKEQIRKELRDKLWIKLEPRLEAYGNLIDVFCRKVSIKTLKEIVRNL